MLRFLWWGLTPVAASADLFSLTLYAGPVWSKLNIRDPEVQQRTYIKYSTVKLKLLLFAGEWVHNDYILLVLILSENQNAIVSSDN
ncbi:MAG: hypothetical protein M3Y56_06655 [Armatimonadota bacterium]|nr:hypothetical protein [Armatimonadota bacterium]